MTIPDLRLRWVRLWDAIGAKGDPLYWFDRIIAQWSLTERHYHDIDHLIEGLEEFDLIRHLFKNPLAVEMAWWLHDVIYDSRQPLGVSEDRSAEFAAHMLEVAELDQSFILLVQGCIYASKHNTVLTEPDLMLFADLDLMRIGYPEEEWKKGSEGIRAEYHWKKDKEYRSDRVFVLRRYYDRNQVFYTEYFQGKFGVQARTNLENSLRDLGAI